MNRVVLALDVATLDEAGRLVDLLYTHVASFKVGLELLTSEGTRKVVDMIHQKGGSVFYDGKFCDIPNTVGKASKAVSNMGVAMFNVHASAGIDAMKAAAQNKGSSLLFAVTVLTSISNEYCCSLYGNTLEKTILKMAYEAKHAGCDGIICSPKDLVFLRREEPLKTMLFMTPGVRPLWSQKDDQKRVATPGEAILNGADYLVIGRPITQPPKGGIMAIKAINEEIQEVIEGE
jgi:orotidine-5'-phosphate decarboxylase